MTRRPHVNGEDTAAGALAGGSVKALDRRDTGGKGIGSRKIRKPLPLRLSSILGLSGPAPLRLLGGDRIVL